MKTIGLCLLWVSLAAGLPAQPSATAATDSAYAALVALGEERPPAELKGKGMKEVYSWHDAHRKAVIAAGLDFYRTYPTDARRWAAVMLMADNPPLFLTRSDPDTDKKGPDMDSAAKAAWEENQAAMEQALRGSTDAAPEQREKADWKVFARDFRATSAARKKGEPHDYGPFVARYDAHVAKYARFDAVVERAQDYLGALESQMPGSSRMIWEHLRTAPNAALREKAQERAAYFEKLSQPLEISFIAVDGRPVDLKALRGKVVLVDFWATWCGPCKAELPGIVASYKKYHDQGFEVVGIALENAGLSPKDSPEQREIKLAKSRKVLTDFTVANDMPWPQYFDGKFWKNDISIRHDIQGIPAMFLLDQEGRVVSTNARGELLEMQIKRLLKL